MANWALRQGSLIIWPQVGTDDTVRVIGDYVPDATLAIDSDTLIFGSADIDDGLNHLREALLMWRVASRLATRNRELSQNLEYRAQQAERELYVAFDQMRGQEQGLTGELRISDA